MLVFLGQLPQHQFASVRIVGEQLHLVQPLKGEVEPQTHRCQLLWRAVQWGTQDGSRVVAVFAVPVKPVTGVALYSFSDLYFQRVFLTTMPYE